MFDKKILLNIGDGPEGIEIYLSEDRAIVDWASKIPSLYINISINGASSCFGPMDLIRDKMIEGLGLRKVDYIFPEEG